MKKEVLKLIEQSSIKQILQSFSNPKTPRQVELELGLMKINLKPLIENDLLVSLNPDAKKGRLYVLSDVAKKLIKMSDIVINVEEDWDIIGWVLASPKQRFVVLKSMDSKKRTSKDIRLRAAKYNPNLTRISTKEILKELNRKGLILTEKIERRRYYWITDKGKKLISLI